MRKLIILSLILFLVPFVYSQDANIKIFQESFSPGENLVAEINIGGSSLGINLDNIKFYLNDEEIKIAPFLYDINENNYIVNFQIPFNLSDGNYTLSLKDMKFNVKGVLVTESFSKKIQIIQSYPVYYISQSLYLIKDQKDFYLKVRSYQDAYLNLSIPKFLDGPPYIYHLPIQEGTQRVFDYKIDYDAIEQDYYEGFVESEGKRYFFPLFVYKEEIKDKTLLSPFSFSIPEIMRKIPYDKSFDGDLYFTNILNVTVDKLDLSLDSNLVSLNQTHFDNILPGMKVLVNVIINEDKDYNNGIYSGNITFKSRSNEENLLFNQMSVPFSIEVYGKESSVIKDDPNEDVEEVEKNDSFGFQDVPFDKEEVREKDRNMSLVYSIVIILILLAIWIYVRLKRPRKEQLSFGEYVSKIEKRK